MTIAKTKHEIRDSEEYQVNKFLLISIVCIVLLYLVYAVFPFYVFGVYRINPETIWSDAPATASVYTVPFSQAIAFIIVGVNYLTGIFVILSVVVSRSIWQSYKPSQKHIIQLILSLGLVVWLFAICTSHGQLISAWILD